VVRNWFCFLLIVVVGLCVAAKPRVDSGPSARPITIKLWPKGAPENTGNIGPERNMTKPSDPLVAGKTVIRLTDVSDPTLTIYRAARNKNSGTAIVVFPGGGYRILAIDLEGTEVCKWLNSIGITAILLKYRVPTRKGLPRYAPPLQDAQRALGLVRTDASDWHIDPQRIGVLGFSAGGNLAAVLSNNYEKRTYPLVDRADRTSCRPDFAMLIYPAYLVVKDDDRYRLAPELKFTEHTPPTFLVQAEDDPIGVQNSIYYYLALKKNHLPAEMHLYAVGGHGYGLRRTQATVTTWPARADQWLRSLGVLGVLNKSR
jgi:acetyl esterase/lipase